MATIYIISPRDLLGCCLNTDLGWLTLKNTSQPTRFPNTLTNKAVVVVTTEWSISNWRKK